MKSVRNLYMVVTAVVAVSLLAGGLAQWLDYGAEDGGHFAGYLQRIPVVSACRIGGAVGVIWLGWYWLKLARGITSIARRLRADNIMNSPFGGKDKAKASGNAVINELTEALSEHLGGCSNTIGRLQKQVNDLQIQIQLTQRQKGHIEAIIYSIHDAVVVIDEFDRLLMANEAAGSLFNFNFSTSQHKYIGELIGQSKSEFADFLQQSRQNKAQPTRKEIEFSENGEPKTFDCIVSCIYDQDRQICGAVAVLHDVTREKEIQQTKNDFVNHVSHELKTPLASIMAYSEMLADGEAKDSQTQQEFYSVIQSQAKRLNGLIEDILNISRIESGLIKVDKEPVSLTILIEEQLKMIKSYAREKGVSLQDIGKSRVVFDQVFADKSMISQVIVNLLSNAVKYTPSGGSIKIETEVDETADIARLSVIDTGVGIPENEIEHVFDKFYRVSANEKQAKGTGLGLNLVKQIIEKVHDGRVFVSSKTGLGSTFGFELPLATREVVESLPVKCGG
ncbi:MAG: PAS domain-containing protein [Planctomycetes bacterium]|nr:PAS domain-containing protein [Planctomycetota bacterium]